MSERFTYEGFDFIMELKPDNLSGLPWKNGDGCGIVSEWRPKDSKRSWRAHLASGWSLMSLLRLASHYAQGS